VNEGFERIELNKIRGSNMRKSDPSIDELAKSIQETGILEPLLVRKKGSYYELLAGSRRLQAAGNAGLKTVPIIVMDVSDEKAFEISLTENLQRENLSSLEIATALSEGVKHFKLSQRQLAKKLGKDVAWVNRHLQILTLPKPVRESLTRVNGLTEGHARHLFGLDRKEQVRIARLAIEHNLTTRETEMVVRRARITETPRQLNIVNRENYAESRSSEINDLDAALWKEYAGKFSLQFHSAWSMSRRHDPFFGVNGTIYPGTFPMMVPINCILRYSREGELVLDPMAGSGTTLVACAMLNRRGIGIDVNPEAERAKQKRFSIVEEKDPKLKPKLDQQKFILGDARDLQFLDDNSVDLVIAHPPYLDMMDYGPVATLKDVASYRRFLREILSEVYRVLRPGRFCCLQIGPFAARNLPLHHFALQQALDLGFEFEDEIVLAFLADYVGYSSSVSGRDTGIMHKEAFASWFSIRHNTYNHNHEYLIILRKPNGLGEPKTGRDVLQPTGRACP
jgi:ParB family chromosome partitioning protein